MTLFVATKTSSGLNVEFPACAPPSQDSGWQRCACYLPASPLEGGKGRGCFGEALGGGKIIESAIEGSIFCFLECVFSPSHFKTNSWLIKFALTGTGRNTVCSEGQDHFCLSAFYEYKNVQNFSNLLSPESVLGTLVSELAPSNPLHLRDRMNCFFLLLPNSMLLLTLPYY